MGHARAAAGLARSLRAGLALSAAAIALVIAVAASAQEVAAPAGNYGGGAVVAPPRSLGGPGNMLISFRVTGSRLRLNASLGADCESGSFRVSTALAADGSFSTSGTRRERLAGGRALTTAYTVAGSVAGAGASGTARVRNRVTQKGREPRTCTSGTVRWGARRSTGELGGAGVIAKARLYGTTSQRLDGPRRAIVLRLSGDATKLTRAIYDLTLRCAGRSETDIYDSPKRNLKIAADGSVSDTERFTFLTSTTVLRSVERFEGKLGMAGASGTFSTVSRESDRRTGRTTRTCRSGTVRWTAAV
jgi:hypothetical protein